ncbi:DUF2971 domain-containing protein [Piscinibacter sakaiensis]|uniref:DUF2971 domain-containing protein n=1 Tax=Piscinibacter sakaiensis TaxID=1547922 RepID=UPI003AAB97AD
MSESKQSKLAEKFRGALWSDFDDEQNFPTARPLLAHYSSVAVLEHIVQAEEVWMSNPLFMNDLEEMRFGMNAGATEFRSNVELAAACGNATTHARLIRIFDEYFRAFEERHALDTYVLCLSEHEEGNQDGLLSMWRGYGANAGGAAIVFDTSKLQADQNMPFVVARVDYATGDERLIWISDKIKAIAQILASGDKKEEDLTAAAWIWLERLKLFAIFTKHPGFKEEREWRIVYYSDRDIGDKFKTMLGYLITPRGVEPKLSWSTKSLIVSYIQMTSTIAGSINFASDCRAGLVHLPFHPRMLQIFWLKSLRRPSSRSVRFSGNLTSPRSM